MNKLEMFNETCILIVSYHLFLFTDFVINAEIRYALGWSLIGVTLSNISINMLVILFFGFH